MRGDCLAEEGSGIWKQVGWRLLLVALVFPGVVSRGQTAMVSAVPPTPLQVVNAMIAHEDDTNGASGYVRVSVEGAVGADGWAGVDGAGGGDVVWAGAVFAGGGWEAVECGAGGRGAGTAGGDCGGS